MIKLKIEHCIYNSVKLYYLFLLILINVFTCRPDDEEDAEPPRDYLEQSLEDDQLITQYLKHITLIIMILIQHPRMVKKLLLTLTSDNSNIKSLYDFAIQTTVPLVSNTGEIIEHKLYHIIVKEGIRTNDRPGHMVDSVYLSYKR